MKKNYNSHSNLSPNSFLVKSISIWKPMIEKRFSDPRSHRLNSKSYMY